MQPCAWPTPAFPPQHHHFPSFTPAPPSPPSPPPPAPLATMAYRQNGPSFLWGLNQLLPPQQPATPGLDHLDASAANQTPFMPTALAAAAPGSPDMAQFSDQLAMWTTASFSFDGPTGHALVADEEKDGKKDSAEPRGPASADASVANSSVDPDDDAERERRLDRERARIHQEHSRLSNGHGQQAAEGASLWQTLEALNARSQGPQAHSPRPQDTQAQTQVQSMPQVQQLLASLGSVSGNPLALLQINQLLSSLGAIGQAPLLPGLEGLNQLGALSALQGLAGAQHEHASLQPAQVQAPLLSLLQTLNASPPAAQTSLHQLLGQLQPQMSHPPTAIQHPTGPPAWVTERAGLVPNSHGPAASFVAPPVFGPVQAPVPSPEEFTSQRPSRSTSPARVSVSKKRRSDSQKGEARRSSTTSSDSSGSDLVSGQGLGRTKKSVTPPLEVAPRSDIDQINIPPLVLVDTGNPEADAEANRLAIEEDKRRRNTAASARFRFKKKQREAALEASHKDLRDRVAQLESMNAKLSSENKWLRSFFSSLPPRDGEDDALASSKGVGRDIAREKSDGAASSTVLGYKRDREDD